MKNLFTEQLSDKRENLTISPIVINNSTQLVYAVESVKVEDNFFIPTYWDFVKVPKERRDFASFETMEKALHDFDTIYVRVTDENGIAKTWRMCYPKRDGVHLVFHRNESVTLHTVCDNVKTSKNRSTLLKDICVIKDSKKYSELIIPQDKLTSVIKRMLENWNKTADSVKKANK